MRRSLLALALAATTALLLGLALFGWRSVRASRNELAFLQPEVGAMERHRAAADFGPAGGPPEDSPYYLSPEEAERLFQLSGTGRVYDPRSAFRTAPGRHARMTWKEHPEGGFLSSTNSEGLADRELDRQAELDLRVLAAGDSHSFGLCSIEETWSSELERGLARRFPGRSFEVLNTAQGAYTFYQYLGMLESYLDWDPDVLVVAVFAGNDFAEQLGLQAVFGEGPGFPLPPQVVDRRREAIETRSREAMGQCFNALLSVHWRPDGVGPALESCLRIVGRMRDVCLERDMLLVVAVIPAPCCLEWDPRPAEFDQLADYLELSGDPCAALDGEIDRFLGGLEELAVTGVDLRPAMAALDEPPFWRRDFHLNLAGQRLVAEAVLPLVAGWAEERGRLR